MTQELTGRKEEIRLLDETYRAKGAGLVAVYGRRRVGKTFLIHTYFKKHLAFELTGMYNVSLKGQLQQFCSPACKDNYYNRLKAQTKKEIGIIDSALKRNRKILKHLFDPRTGKPACYPQETVESRV